MPSIIPKITINGKESTEISGLIIVSLPPIIKPAMRAVAEEIDGRDGDQIEKLGFSAYDKTIRIALSGNYDVDDVIEYFNQDGIITFSNEPDKYYRFKQLEGIDFEKLMRYKTADVVFHCQPFKFSTTEDELTFFEPHSVSITNAGNIYSKPEIALTGHGNMEMGINGSPVLAVDFGDEQQTIIIDSEKMNAYGAQSNIKSLITEINPKQDLHGYDSAWMEKGNNSPYLFRKVAGTASRFGNGIYDQIVGGSIAFNQHIDLDGGSWLVAGMNVSANNGNMIVSGTANVSSTGSLVPSRVYNKTKPVFNHKYCLSIKGNHNFESLNFAIYGNTNQYLNSMECIFECNVQNSTDAEIIASFVSGNNYSANLKAYLIDLTQMLGSTIADYIYSLEQATAGAGVSYFKALFPNDYYPYNAGELLSVKALAHNTIGFNQWDEETRNGYYGLDGNFYSNADYIASKNMISVIPSEYYYLKCGSGNYFGRFVWYDANKNFIDTSVNTGNTEIQIPANAYYMNFDMKADYGSTYNHDICINYSNSSLNGNYKAYSINRYFLDADLELRGIPQIDANGKLTYDGDKYSSDGNVNRKMGFISDLSSLSWLMGNRNNSDTGYIFYMPSLDMKEYSECITSKLFTNRAGEIGLWESLELNEISVVRDYLILCSDKTNVEDLKAQISSISLAYFKKVATSETAQPFTNPQNVDANGSEEYIDGNVYGIVDLGSLSWSYSSDYRYFIAQISDVKTNSLREYLNHKYPTVYWNSSASQLIDAPDKTAYYQYANNNYFIKDSSFTDATAFKNSLSGVYCIYEKASSADVSIPVGHNTLYANICEIGGWNSCDVKRTGKNLLIPFVERTITENGITFAVNSDGTIHATGRSTGRSNLFHGGDMIAQNLRAGNYVISDGVERSAHYMLEIAIWQNGNLNYYSTSGIDHFTISDGDSVQSIYISIFDGAGDVDLVFQPQIELGSEATDFEAYEGITKNIPFNQTIYKARLNIKTGRMEILGAYAEFDGSNDENWNDYHSSYDGFMISVENMHLDGLNPSLQMISNIATVNTNRGNSTSFEGVVLKTYNATADDHYFFICGTGAKTETELRNWLACTNLKIVFEIASPIILQLTAQEIMALIGENHIFTNTGAIESCVYMKDGAEIETSGEIITFIADVGDIISNAFKNRLVIGNYDDVKLEKGINTITFNPIEEGSEIDEMAISKYSRWL